MILNDRWIKENSWMFDPYDENMVNPASIDLRWSGRYRLPLFNSQNKPVNYDWVIRTYVKEDLNKFWQPYAETDYLLIFPRQFVLIDTLETLEMPVDICGLLMLKSSTGRFGLEHHHAGFFDPGFGLGNPSTATLEITNTSPFALEIKKGQPLVQMVFMRMEEVPNRDYRVTGHFNGQKSPVGAGEWEQIVTQQKQKV